MTKIKQYLRLFGNALRTKLAKNPDSGIAGMKVDMPRILIAAGIVTLCAAGVIAGYGIIDDYLAGQRARAVLERMWEETPASVPAFPQLDLSSSADTGESLDTDPYSIQPDIPEETASSESPEVSAPLEPLYDTVGVLTIPKLALELPILSECSDSLLKISICRYEGNAVDRPERLIIAGHNYKSHFGKLTKLAVGDEICFSGNGGVIYNYTVTAITNISMYDHKALEEGEWDLTLFTCDSDRSRRILIRCRENV